jgi:hypothetical protein
MAAAVVSAAGYFPHWAAWAGYAALAVHAASLLTNWATPSKAERALWGPTNTVMFGLAAYLVLF